MRKAAVYLRGEFAGELTEISRNEYIFNYDNDYFENVNKPAISLTLPKSQKEYRSEYLFPFPAPTAQAAVTPPGWPAARLARTRPRCDGLLAR